MAQTHYTTLNLAETQQASEAQLKAAFRHALLTHHPDKNLAQTSPVTLTKSTTEATSPSIDAIKTAYAVLSDPSLRAAYDRQLLLSRKTHGLAEHADKSFHTGEDVVDLDDLAYDEDVGSWYRGCRCGEVRGYVVTEMDLEKEVQGGGAEVVVGCVGCSLWIRVGFGVMDEDEVEGNAKKK